MTSAPLGAGNDAWGARTQSPSVASGSSNEGWLQSNGNANQNGRGATPAGPPAEGWLIKSTAVGALGAAPLNHAANNGSSSSDPWLAEPAASAAGGAAAVGLADPWAPGAASQTGAGALDDPWKALGTGAIKVSGILIF